MPARRNPRDSRRAPRREPGRRILVVCGGLRTEPAYLEGLKSWARNPAVRVRVKPRGGSPQQLVQYAIEVLRRERENFDEAWCVFDVDDFDIAEAVAHARRAGIELAVSNPCFELWLLLHHGMCQGHMAGYPQVVAKLRKYVPGYDKASLDFRQFADGVGEAVERAKKLGEDCAVNPSTGVWRLVARVMG
ncbi:MAG: RloB family protein [Mycobacteriales bacterium]